MPGIPCRIRRASSIVAMVDVVFEVMVSHDAVYRRLPVQNARSQHEKPPADTTPNARLADRARSDGVSSDVRSVVTEAVSRGKLEAHASHVALLGAFFYPRFESLPDRDHIRVVVSRPHTFGLPGHDFYVHGRVIGAAEHHERIVGHEAQPVQRRPVPHANGCNRAHWLRALSSGRRVGVEAFGARSMVDR